MAPVNETIFSNQYVYNRACRSDPDITFVSPLVQVIRFRRIQRRPKLFKLLLVPAVFVIAAFGCASQQPIAGIVVSGSSDSIIRISGAGGTTGVLMALAEEYSRTNSGVSFTFLEGSGSAGGVKGVNADLLDLGAMSRRPKELEIETGIRYITFAEERVAVVTSPNLPLSMLNLEQVRAIFTGEIDNWSRIGGPDALIRLIVRVEDDSNTQIIRAGIIGDAPFGRTAVIMSSEADAMNALNSAANAIGYLAYSAVVAGDLSVHPVALDGWHPADADRAYPLASRTLGVAFLPEKVDHVQGFVDFLTGSDAREMLARHGLLAVE